AAPDRRGRVAARRRAARRARGLVRGSGMKADAAIERLGRPAKHATRFPDGAHFRIEIPSVEGPLVLEEVVNAARTEGIVVNRVSQGSGAMLLREDELREMSRIGAESGIEVSLFVGPREGFGVGATAASFPADGTLEQLAEFRAASSLPIDLYVESPDSLGGVVRGDELSDLVEAGAPLYAKFGLRNSRPLYPAGAHLVGDACA